MTNPRLTSPWLVIALITFIGAILRVYHLDFNPLWSDEAVLYWIAKSDLSQVVAQNAARNSAPPLFPLLLHGVVAFDDSESALRSISCLASVAAIPAMYGLAREFLPREASYFCALLTAISRSQVQYAQQVREYSLSFLLAVLLLKSVASYLRSPTWKNCALVLVCGALSIWTQYGLALLIAALMFVLAVSLFRAIAPKPSPLHLLTICAGLLAVTALIYTLSLKQQLAHGAATNQFDYVESGYWNGSARSLLKLLVVNTYGIFNFALTPGWIVLPLVALGLIQLQKSKQRAVWPLFLAPMAMVFIAACARKYPYFGARQTLFLAPMIYLLASFGWVWIRGLKPKLAPVAAFAASAFCLFFTSKYLSTRAREDIRPVTRTLASQIQTGDAVFVYYGAGSTFPYYFRQPIQHLVISQKNRAHPETYLQELSPLLRQKRVWLVFSRDNKQDRTLLLSYAARTHKVKFVVGDSVSSLYLCS